MRWHDPIGRRIKFRDLHIAMTVAESGSMLKAAQELAISQPVVSKVVADLEQVLGARLFDRSKKGVEPTASGRALLRRARAVFDELRQGAKEIAFLNDPTTGELQVGASPALMEGILVAVIDRMSRQYPGIVFDIVPDGLPEQYGYLRERRSEVGLARIAQSASEDDFQVEVLFDEPLVVVAGAENAWARRRKVKLAELVNERWTWPAAGTTFDSLVVQAFRASGVEAPRPAVYVDDFRMRLKLAATGRFLAIVPASVMRFAGEQSSIKLLPSELPTTQSSIAIITLKNRTLTPLARAFVECAREVIKPAKRDGRGYGGL
jgi:DNA-binding transcriptional LysR family regulator